MKKFVAKRVGISLLILLAASVLMYGLTILSGDPLADLRESTDPNRENLMERRIANMGLDKPWYERYWSWLRGIGGCFVGSCDFGVNRSGQSVNALLGNAASATIRLVFIAVMLSIVIGIFFGMMTAIRQYSGFDYVVTFMAFVFYSLPSFVFAVLLKEYGAITFNDWLPAPTISILASLIAALIFGLFIQALVAGSPRRRLTVGLITGGVVFGMMQLLSITRWFANPISGWYLQLIIGVAAAVLFTSLFTGLSNRRVLTVALSAGVGTALFTLILELTGSFNNPTWGRIVLFALAAALISATAGYFFGGYAKRAALWVCFWSSLSVFGALIVDFLLRHWVEYVKYVSRPISTIGSETPNFLGANDFWLTTTDSLTHILLPTISLTLMSIAAYTRYTRSAMLDVLGQDYIRTARSKGLPERMVITRHAFRNAMIPITTIVAFDFAGLIGGAVITETVFGWKGMGELFKVGLSQVDPPPVMAFFVVTATAAVTMNMVADILYAYIDPRIRR